MFDIYAAAYVSSAAAIIGWVQFFFARRDKRVEKAEKEEAQVRLALHERRAQATLFFPVFNDLGSSLAIAGGEEILTHYAGVLNCHNREVPVALEAGKPVYLPVFNLGGGFIEISASSNAEDAPTVFVRYTDGGPTICGVLHYPFTPAKRGTVLIISFDYVSPNGVVRRDVYEHKYGFLHLHRIDPPRLDATKK